MRRLFAASLSLLTVILVATPGWTATLESPARGALISGLGFISGWKCDAGDITVRINDGGHIPVATGQPRADVRHICGTIDHGFITQMNWALLGDGEHQIVAYDDGVKFASATFTVVTTGEEFLEGAVAECYVPDFPAPGENARLEWVESTQHFELAEVGSDIVVPEPETPQPPVTPDPPTTPTNAFHGTWKVTTCDFGSYLCDEIWKIIQSGNAISIVMHWTEEHSVLACRASSSSRFTDLAVTGNRLTGTEIVDATSIVCGFRSSMNFTVSADGNRFSGTYSKYTNPECDSSYRRSGTITAVRTNECS